MFGVVHFAGSVYYNAVGRLFFIFYFVDNNSSSNSKPQLRVCFPKLNDLKVCLHSRIFYADLAQSLKLLRLLTFIIKPRLHSGNFLWKIFLSVNEP